MPPQRFSADDAWLAGIGHLQDDLVERGMSLNRLSDETGIARMTITRMMSGERAGTIGGQKAIAELLGRDPGLYFPRNEVELRRAEALNMREGSMALAGNLRGQAAALTRAADAIEELAS